MKRIGVLTGGGDCPGLNAVLRAIVKTAHDSGLEVIGFKDGFRGVVMNEYIPLTPKEVVGILVKGGTILGSSNRDNPYHFCLEQKGETIYADLSDQAVANMERLGLDCLIVIGGDGTLACAYDFMKKGVKIIGVPKTIDNDLNGTDLTFGFMTAIDTATDALEKLHTTAESHHRVMVLEVMGRNAGWIALQAGIAGGADVVLIPEIPFTLERVAKKIFERKKRGRNFSIIIAAEGAKPEGGQQVVKRIVEGSPEPIRLGGIGEKIAQGLEENTGFESRVIVLGHLQRGGKPSAFDRILASRYGVAAVRMASQGLFGMMASLQGTEITTVPIEVAIKELKTVPPDGEMVQTAHSIGISFGAEHRS
ncbi:MAG TPA: 6-phosphofructokinase [Firmicutes bacterium]|jgi:phosphofructokinase-like protein|nr:6-phosphofructokinase [Bacillota bacterium]